MTDEVKIFKWLNEHDLIPPLRLERKLSIPDRSLTKAIAGLRPLPDKYIEPLIKELRRYGYK